MDKPDFEAAIEAAMTSAVTVERLNMLATEWKAKTITSERFATRAYEVLAEHDTALKKASQRA